MVHRTDEAGKVWFLFTIGSDTTVRFAIGARCGQPFTPNTPVEIGDEELARLTEQILQPFGAASVPVVETA